MARGLSESDIVAAADAAAAGAFEALKGPQAFAWWECVEAKPVDLAAFVMTHAPDAAALYAWAASRKGKRRARIETAPPPLRAAVMVFCATIAALRETSAAPHLRAVGE